MSYKFTPPNPDDYEEEPFICMTRNNGSIMKVYKHKTDKGRRRVTIDGKPYDPTSNYIDAISNGLIKKH